MDRDKQIILIVDDEPINIRTLSETLQHDYEIAVALDGQTALETATSTAKPDLILLDISMPGMDGYEVCRKLKDGESTKGIPIIFVTARNETEAEGNGLNLGAVDYISKPYNIPVILARVRNHLAMKRKSDLLESLALLDGLTGIANRRRFIETIDTEWKRAIRSGKPLSLISHQQSEKQVQDLS